MTAASDSDQPAPASAQAHVGRQRLRDEILQGGGHGVVSFQGGLVPRRQRIAQVDELRHGCRNIAVGVHPGLRASPGETWGRRHGQVLLSVSRPRWYLWQESGSCKCTPPALAPTGRG